MQGEHSSDEGHSKYNTDTEQKIFTQMEKMPSQSRIITIDLDGCVMPFRDQDTERSTRSVREHSVDDCEHRTDVTTDLKHVSRLIRPLCCRAEENTEAIPQVTARP